jgi:hypothetical protein
MFDVKTDKTDGGTDQQFDRRKDGQAGRWMDTQTSSQNFKLTGVWKGKHTDRVMNR